MHKSRLAGFIIDCNTDDLDGAAKFWSAALGYPLRPAEENSDPKYIGFETGDEGLSIEVQKVAHDSRVHLDIEADDIEAEARRLEALGAKRIGKVKTWIVLEAPTGHRFCVIEPQKPTFESKANKW
jgi:predicted enzyme related to lactoylglutathione lyase